jgi:hypothetical protein
VYLELTADTDEPVDYGQPHEVRRVDGERHMEWTTPTAAGPERIRIIAPVPPPGEFERVGLYGFGDEPSTLIDPGGWRTLEETSHQQAEAALRDESTVEMFQRALEELSAAIGAVDEQVKFLPPDADAVPGSAFFTVPGREVWTREPEAFARSRLMADGMRYREQLHGLGGTT